MNSYPSRIVRFALAVIFAVQPLLLPVLSSSDSSLALTAAASTLEDDTYAQTYTELREDYDLGDQYYGLPDDYEPPQIAPPDTPVWVNLSLSKRLISPPETAQLSINVVPV